MPDNGAYLKVAAGLAGGRAAPARKARCIRSEDLFDGQDEVVIEHSGRYYLLRKEHLGGLVLTGLDGIDIT